MDVTVEAMHSPARAERATHSRMLLRRLATVFLVGLVGGVGLSFVGLANRTIAPVAFGWATCASLGLISGFSARRALRDHTALLRTLAGIASVIISMLFIGWISGGDAGLVLHRQGRPAADWNGLLQVTIGAASATLAMAAWNHRRLRTPADLTQRTPYAEGQRQVDRRPSPGLTGRAVAALQGASRGLQTGVAIHAGRFRRGLARRARGWKSLWQGSWLSERLPQWNLPAGFLRRRESIQPGRVRLLGVEEHRCPYCLDVVERHDPRGVVTCKVCHTRHHADCWAVTGMCQVPHHHRQR
jgi:hypothetical protein